MLHTKLDDVRESGNINIVFQQKLKPNFFSVISFLSVFCIIHFIYCNYF